MIRLFRDAAAADAGASSPTLSDIFQIEDDNGWPADTPPPIKAGDGTDKPVDLAAAITDTPPMDDPPAGDEPPAGGNDEPPAGDDNVIVDDESGDVTPEEFFKEVQEITGEEITVDYGTPDTPEYIDPLSPEGIALYTKAVRADEVVRFENHIKTQDPRAYAYFVHRSEGGDDESFFAEKTVKLPTLEEFSGNADQQASLYKQSLIAKGIEEDIAEAQVAKAIANNNLKEKAVAVYNATQAAQVEQLRQVELQAAKEEQAYLDTCAAMETSINKAIDTNLLNFNVPVAQKAGFKSFVKEALRYEDGKFWAVQEIGTDMDKTLDALYFRYLKGNLNDLVEKRAGTKTVQRLRLGVSRAKTSGGAVQGNKNTDGKYIPLGEI